jgi:hypothetical protein
MRRTVFTLIALTALGRAGTEQELLDLAARAAEREIADLSSVACTETVVETKLSQKEKTEERRRRTFDYLVLLDTDDGDLSVTESRIEQSGTKKTEAKPLLASTGFATLLLILHPYYQNSFEFSDLGLVEEGGRQWRRLGFEFRPGKRSPSVLRAGAREYPLAWKGEARLDPATGRVASIQASLGAQLEEIGLESLEANVRYGPPEVKDAARDSAEWLPLEAAIDLKTHHQHWRNVHTFGGYKHFDVTTTEKQEAAKQP